MSESQYKNAVAMFQREFVDVEESGYRNEVFGSWWLTVKSSPPIRLVWDGKEGWLVVQRQTDRMFNGMPVWEDLWRAFEASERAIAEAVTHIPR